MAIEITALIAISLLVCGIIFLMQRIKVNSLEQSLNSANTLLNEKDEVITQIKASEQRIDTERKEALSRIQPLESEVADLRADKKHSDSVLNEEKRRNNEEVVNLKARINSLETKRSENEAQLVRYEENEKSRRDECDKKLNQLDDQIQHYKDKKKKLHEEQEEKIEASFLAQQELWKKHEELVELKVRELCQKHQAEYVDKDRFPHRGKPDNLIKICDELVVFDSKAPGKNNSDNFFNHIKKQAESAEKYAKYDGVRKEIYFVIPTGMMNSLNQSYFQFPKYNVTVINIDALDPIIRELKKIENYAFTEEFDPEDRDKIVSIIGRLSKNLKRHVEINNDLTKKDLHLISEIDLLPENFLAETKKIEKVTKVNPTSDRGKDIDVNALIKNHKEIQSKYDSINI